MFFWLCIDVCWTRNSILKRPIDGKTKRLGVQNVGAQVKAEELEVDQFTDAYASFQARGLWRKQAAGFCVAAIS